jgi:hypothetical protein
MLRTVEEWLLETPGDEPAFRESKRTSPAATGDGPWAVFPAMEEAWVWAPAAAQKDRMMAAA